MICGPSSNMGHVGSKLGHGAICNLVRSLYFILLIHFSSHFRSEWFSEWNLGQVQIWVMRPFWNFAFSLLVIVFSQLSSNLVRMFVSITSRPISSIGHVGSKVRSDGNFEVIFMLWRIYFFTIFSLNLGRIFILLQSMSSLNKWFKTLQVLNVHGFGPYVPCGGMCVLQTHF